jgi:uncharacterized damage-inducible protein DinB
MAIAQSFLPEIENEARSTRKLLERVPADKLSWKPHPKSMSLGQLAMHVASVPGRLAQMATRDGFDAATASFEAPAPKDATELLPALEASLAQARDLFSTLDDAKASAPWRLTHGEREIFTIPRAAMIRTMLLNHWYHHRGQLTVYLRLLDVPLPVVYGRSADENPFAAPGN